MKVQPAVNTNSVTSETSRSEWAEIMESGFLLSEEPREYTKVRRGAAPAGLAARSAARCVIGLAGLKAPGDGVSARDERPQRHAVDVALLAVADAEDVSVVARDVEARAERPRGQMC